MNRAENNKKNKCKMKEFDNINITQHYIERYYERILNSRIPNNSKFADVRENVLNDMLIRMSIIEMNCFSFLSNCNKVVIPLQGTKRIVIKDHTLITVTGKD